MNIRFGTMDIGTGYKGRYPFDKLETRGSYFEVSGVNRKNYMRISAARIRYTRKTGIQFAMRSDEGTVRVIRKS